MGPSIFLPKFKLHPVDLAFVAERQAAHALEAPKGRGPDIHGRDVVMADVFAKASRLVTARAGEPSVYKR